MVINNGMDSSPYKQYFSIKTEERELVIWENKGIVM